MSILVNSLSGRTLCLPVQPGPLSVAEIRERLYAAEGIPAELQLLYVNGRLLSDETQTFELACPSDFLSVRVGARLVGGKGGFGSNLRSAHIRVGMKDVKDLDRGACRDLNGRRIWHVEAEKQLQDFAQTEIKVNHRMLKEQFHNIREGKWQDNERGVQFEIDVKEDESAMLLSFRYDKQQVTTLKKIVPYGGLSWNRQMRFWEVRMVHAKCLKVLVEEFGFRFSPYAKPFLYEKGEVVPRQLLKPHSKTGLRSEFGAGTAAEIPKFDKEKMISAVEMGLKRAQQVKKKFIPGLVDNVDSEGSDDDDQVKDGKQEVKKVGTEAMDEDQPGSGKQIERNLAGAGFEHVGEWHCGHKGECDCYEAHTCDCVGACQFDAHWSCCNATQEDAPCSLTNEDDLLFTLHQTRRVGLSADSSSSSSLPSSSAPSFSSSSSSSSPAASEHFGIEILKAEMEAPSNKKQKRESGEEGNPDEDSNASLNLSLAPPAPSVAAPSSSLSQPLVISNSKRARMVAKAVSEGIAPTVAVSALPTTTTSTSQSFAPIDLSLYKTINQLIEALPPATASEHLKHELQRVGLKCGGDVQQRAERLWLLKGTTIDQIHKKHLAPKPK